MARSFRPKKIQAAQRKIMARGKSVVAFFGDAKADRDLDRVPEKFTPFFSEESHSGIISDFFLDSHFVWKQARAESKLVDTISR